MTEQRVADPAGEIQPTDETDEVARNTAAEALIAELTEAVRERISDLPRSAAQEFIRGLLEQTAEPDPIAAAAAADGADEADKNIVAPIRSANGNDGPIKDQTATNWQAYQHRFWTGIGLMILATAAAFTIAWHAIEHSEICLQWATRLGPDLAEVLWVLMGTHGIITVALILFCYQMLRVGQELTWPFWRSEGRPPNKVHDPAIAVLREVRATLRTVLGSVKSLV